MRVYAPHGDGFWRSPSKYDSRSGGAFERLNILDGPQLRAVVVPEVVIGLEFHPHLIARDEKRGCCSSSVGLMLRGACPAGSGPQRISAILDVCPVGRTHLDRKFEKSLAMIIPLQKMRERKRREVKKTC